MIRTRCLLGGWTRLLAVLVVCLAPAAARAEFLYFRNECRYPLVVQASCQVGGVVRRDKPYLLRNFGDTVRIALPGDKVITVYDGKVTNRILFQGSLRAGAVDMFFGIEPDKDRPGKVKMGRRVMPARPGAMGAPGMGGPSMPGPEVKKPAESEAVPKKPRPSPLP